MEPELAKSPQPSTAPREAVQQRAIVNRFDGQQLQVPGRPIADNPPMVRIPHFVVIDEIHRHPRRRVDGAILQKSTATAGRSRWVIYTTTADYNRPSPCNRLLLRIATGPRQQGRSFKGWLRS